MTPGETSPAATPAVLVGVGLGAFFDGIVFHQLLQWHHFVSNFRSADDLAGLQHNTLWDGIFHAGTWVVLAAALLWLWQRRSAARNLGFRPFLGLLAIGWGGFNVMDELLLHLALQAHHIRMGPDWLLYDLAYTAAGLVLMVVGGVLVRRHQAAA